MSAFLVRNNSIKICFKSCYSKNLKMMTNNVFMIKNNKFLQNQVITPTISRYAATQSLEIKQYQSRRKFTLTWKFERVMGWSLIVLIPMAFAVESKGLEMLLSIVVLTHTYLGCQSMCSDYLRSAVVGKLLPVIARSSIIVLTLTSAVGIHRLIYNDVGLINMIKEFWSIRGRDYVPPKHLRKVQHKQKKTLAVKRI